MGARPASRVGRPTLGLRQGSSPRRLGAVQRAREHRRHDPASRPPPPPPWPGWSALAGPVVVSLAARSASAIEIRTSNVSLVLVLVGARRCDPRRTARPARSPRSCRWPRSTSSSPARTIVHDHQPRRRRDRGAAPRRRRRGGRARGTRTAERRVSAARVAPRWCGCDASPSSRRAASPRGRLIGIVQGEIVSLLPVRQCRFEPWPTPKDLPELTHNGVLSPGGDLATWPSPPERVALPVFGAGRRSAASSSTSRPAPRASPCPRGPRLAVALADQLGTVLVNESH